MKKRSRKIEGNTKKGQIWEKTDGHCHLCSERLYTDEWRIDHLLPRAQGGSDEEWNLLPCCVFCNGMKKAAKTYMMQRVLLYGRYCLEEATRRDTSEGGKTIYEVVGGHDPIQWTVSLS